MDASARADAPRPDNPADRPVTAGGALAALGVVFGDLGTSPLYTYQAIVGTVGGHPSAEAALGLLSLVVWSLIVIVSIKYCVLVMRADNRGEGGILALMALVTGRAGRMAGVLTVAGLFGAALLYGDGVITPSISVLSALEGINEVTDAVKPYVAPAALVVLVALFAAQTFGTARIGKVFGPVMLLWFVVIAVLGLSGVVRRLDVLLAIDPRHAVRLVWAHGWHTFVVLGGVFLALTGGEALYADMGHIGRNPVRVSWFCVVLPALLLCYAGQTALLLDNPGITGNPFFKLAPQWSVLPLVVLEPFLSQALQMGIARQLNDLADASHGTATLASTSVPLVYSEVFARDRTTAQTFMDCYLRGVRLYNDAFQRGIDKDRIIGILADRAKLDAGVVRNGFPAGLDPNGRVSVPFLEQCQTYFIEQHYLQAPIDLKQLVDASFADSTVARLGEYKAL